MCRAFKKRATSQAKNTEAWESMSFYDEPRSGGVSSVVDSLDYMTRQNVVMCKQELPEAKKLSFSHSDQFVQLPQLHSPSLPSTKRPTSSTSILASENYKEDRTKRSKNDSTDNKVLSTDWRDLDKFVASQLSQEKKYEGIDNGNIGMSDFGEHVSNSDMALLLLESEFCEDSNNLNEFFNSD